MLSRIRRASDGVSDIDRAISRAVSSLPPSPVDATLKDLSRAADHSLLWFTVAAGHPTASTVQDCGPRGVFRVVLAR